MLEEFASYATYSILNLERGSALASSVEFFIYDSIKVTLLLAIAIFIVGIIRTYVTKQKVRKWLGGKKEGVGNILAALFGIPTPFCSCSAVPIFIGFVEAGIPLGVTFSFLIASPLINEVAVALLFATFGWQVAALYVTTGLIVAIVAGIIIGRLGLESEIESFRGKGKFSSAFFGKMKFSKRVEFGIEESRRITFKVLPYLLLGIALGSIIHGYAPSDLLVGIAGKDNPLAVPIAVLLGIPLYSNAAGMVPIVEALVAKGMATGTALAFMMGVIGLSLPEFIILRKVLKPKLLAIFILVLFLSFTLVGYLLNAILP